MLNGYKRESMKTLKRLRISLNKDVNKTETSLNHSRTTNLLLSLLLSLEHKSKQRKVSTVLDFYKKLPISFLSTEWVTTNNSLSLKNNLLMLHNTMLPMTNQSTTELLMKSVLVTLTTTKEILN